MKKILLAILILALCAAPLAAEFGVGIGYTNLFNTDDPALGDEAMMLNLRATATLQVFLIDLGFLKLGGEAQLGAMYFEANGTTYIFGELPLDIVAGIEVAGIGVQAFAGYCAEFIYSDALDYINMANAGARVLLGGLYVEAGGIFALQTLTDLNIDGAMNTYTLKAGVGFFF